MHLFIVTSVLAYFKEFFVKTLSSEISPFRALQWGVFAHRSRVVLLVWIISVVFVSFLLCFRVRLFAGSLW